MADITIQRKNDVYIRVLSDPSIAQELSDHFTFEVPGAKFHPLYRNKMWDGRIRLFSIFTKELYVGLLQYLEHFAESNSYTIDYEQYTSQADSVTLDVVKVFIEEFMRIGIDYEEWGNKFLQKMREENPLKAGSRQEFSEWMCR